MPNHPHRTPEELLDSLRRLSDDQLMSRLASLAARLRHRTALLVAHLAELDTRDVHLRLGYSSLFVYCREALGLSEDEAYNRIEAARAARRFPVVLDLLAEGSVTLTAVRLLGRHLTAENHARALESARGKRKAEVEEIVAALCPRDDVPPSIRKLPEARATGVPLGRPSALPSGESGAAPLPQWPVLDGATAGAAPGTPGEAARRVSVGAPVESPPVPRADGEERPRLGMPGPATVRARPRSSAITPLSPGRYRYQLTVSGSTIEKLRLAKDMLRHALPSGDDEAVLGLALDALLMDLSRKKFAATGRGDTCRRPAPGTRTVPAAVRRAVWVRDLGGCAFVGSEGRRCGERAFVEFHHVWPYAAGGTPTIENIQLRCRQHNAHEGRVFLAGHADDGRREEPAEAVEPGGKPPGPDHRPVPERVGGTRPEPARVRLVAPRPEPARVRPVGARCQPVPERAGGPQPRLARARPAGSSRRIRMPSRGAPAQALLL